MYPLLDTYFKKSEKSKADIADEVGVPVSTFYEKISGKSKIDLELAKKIKKAVGASESLEALFSTSATPAA